MSETIEIIKKLIENLPLTPEQKQNAYNLLPQMNEEKLGVFKNKLLDLYHKRLAALKKQDAEIQKFQREIANPIFKKAEEEAKKTDDLQMQNILSGLSNQNPN